MKKKYYVIFIILAGILWSFSGLLRRIILDIPSMYVVMIDHVFRVVFFLPILPKFIKEYRKMNRRDWLYITIVAFFSGALATYFFQKALTLVHFINFSVVILLQQVRPLFSIGLAALVLKEKITKRYGVLAVIALISAYFLTFPNFKPNFIGGNGELLAAAFAFSAAAMWGSTVVISKKLLQKFSYAAVANLRFMIVVPISLIFIFLSQQSYSLSSISPDQWLNLALIGLLSGVVSFVLYYKGLQYTEVKVSTFAEYSWPVSAALVGFFILGERLTVIQLISALVLVTDIVILSFLQKSVK